MRVDPRRRLSTRGRVLAALGVTGMATAVALGLVLALGGGGRVRLEVKTGVVESVHRIARRVRVLTSQRLSEIFVAASKEEQDQALNEERMPPTPHDPSAVRSQSSSFVPTVAEAGPAAVATTPDDLVLFDKTLVDRGDASHIAEPSVAADGKRVL